MLLNANLKKCLIGVVELFFKSSNSELHSKRKGIFFKTCVSMGILCTRFREATI